MHSDWMTDHLCRLTDAAPRNSCVFDSATNPKAVYGKWCIGQSKSALIYSIYYNLKLTKLNFNIIIRNLAHLHGVYLLCVYKHFDFNTIQFALELFIWSPFNEYILFWGFDSITIINCSPDFIQCYENGRLQF